MREDPEDAKEPEHLPEPEFKISYSPRDPESPGSEMHMVPTMRGRLRRLIEKLRGH